MLGGCQGQPSLLEGQGLPEWLALRPRAGRAVRRQRMRRAAREQGGPWRCVTLREARAIEEAPSAYKPIEEVIRAQLTAGLVREVARFSPMLTFKA